MALQFKPTVPPEGIRATCISVLLCEECQQFDAVMFRLNEPVFSIKHLFNADPQCDKCYDKAFSEVSE